MTEEVNQALANKLVTVNRALEKTITLLEWIKNFSSDKSIVNTINDTLQDIRNVER